MYTITCPACHRQFRSPYRFQRYCSRKCRDKYYSSGEYTPTNYEVVSFNCAMCGRHVVTEGGTDKRSRFCCRECEHKYWKHPPCENESIRQNFRSIEEYASWERRTND